MAGFCSLHSRTTAACDINQDAEGPRYGDRTESKEARPDHTVAYRKLFGGAVVPASQPETTPSAIPNLSVFPSLTLTPTQNRHTDVYVSVGVLNGNVRERKRERVNCTRMVAGVSPFYLF